MFKGIDDGYRISYASFKEAYLENCILSPHIAPYFKRPQLSNKPGNRMHIILEAQQSHATEQERQRRTRIENAA